MAEEDIIFGKNRHFFGGIEPSDMAMFNASSMYNVEKNIFSIKLECKLPKDTIIDNQKICTVDGAVIRRRADRYPINEFDGVLIADIKEDQNVIDTNVEEGVTYYYAAFPYSRLGVYNRSKENKTNAKVVKRQYLFGYDINLSDPNPETRVSYPSDVDNANYAPARMDFEADAGGSYGHPFNYGDWPSNAGEKFMPRPCSINTETGLVYKYIKEDTSVGYNESQFLFYEDGTSSDIRSSNQYNLAYMMEWPKIYTKREEINGVYKFRCSDVPEDETWNCWCNYDDNNNIIDHFYISMGSLFTTSIGTTSGNKTKLYSKFDESSSGMKVPTLYEYAKNTGPGWSPFRLVDHLLIQDLLVMMAKTTDLQSAYGYGATDSSPSSSYIAKMFFGTSSTENYETNIVFGLLNYLNCYSSSDFIDGWLMIRNGDTCIQKIKITGGTIDGSSCTGFNTTGDGYIEVEGATIPYSSSSAAKYISKMKTTPWGRIPYVAEGSSTTYECDAMFIDKVNDGYVCIAHRRPSYGGTSNSSSYIVRDARNGGFSVGMSSVNSVNICGRLSYKPPKKES